MTSKALLIVALAGLFSLAGCATVEGFGRDISAGARKVGDMF